MTPFEGKIPIVSIHQSQYLPWFPYFKKVAMADIFVVMDNVQYQKNGLQNRNKIRNHEGDFWLTIPVTGHLDDLILDKKIANDSWKQKHWKSIKASYSKAPYWNMYKDPLELLYEKKYFSLHEVNKNFFEFLLEMLCIRTKIVYLSELVATGTKSDLVLSICKELGASTYITGTGGKSYLIESDFEIENIKVEYIESISPEYTQYQGDFIPDLSIIDMLFNVDHAVINNRLRSKTQ
jgi:hypothetical protein